MKIKAGWVGVVLGAWIVGSGCSSIKIQKDQVAAVHKVAIVGFAINQRMPNSGESVLKSFLAPRNKNAMMGNLHPAEIAEPAAHADMMYDALIKDLANGMSWQIVSREDLRGNIDYQSLYQDKTRQPQPRPLLPGDNMKVFTPQGIVEEFLLNTMNLQSRAELIRKLGVDAIAMATIRVELENGGGIKKIVGMGDFHTKATLAFRVYDATHKDPIWMDVWAAGEPTDESVDHTLGFANVDALNQQAVLATTSAYTKLLARYQAK